MNAPAEVAGRFAAVCLLGLGLGAVYGFLRPPRQRHVHLTDGIFLVFFTWAWLWAGFGICQGDLRLGYTMGLFLGIFAWELTAGRLLRPAIDLLWRGIWKILGFPGKVFAKIFQKTRNFVKKRFASDKKSGTIEWN